MDIVCDCRMSFFIILWWIVPLHSLFRWEPFILYFSENYAVPYHNSISILAIHSICQSEPCRHVSYSSENYPFPICSALLYMYHPLNSFDSMERVWNRLPEVWYSARHMVTMDTFLMFKESWNWVIRHLWYWSRITWDNFYLSTWASRAGIKGRDK